MNPFTLAGGTIGFLFYIPLCIQILTGKVVQNFATYALWALLDGIVAASTLYQHGNFLLPLAYTAGALAASLSILKSKNFGWTWFESTMTCLVAGCIVIWYFSDAYVATIAATIAFVFSTAPLIRECYKWPEKQPLGTYLGFLVANVLGTIGGNSWSVKERLYPIAATALCVTLLLLIVRRYRLQKNCVIFHLDAFI